MTITTITTYRQNWASKRVGARTSDRQDSKEKCWNLAEDLEARSIAHDNMLVHSKQSNMLTHQAAE